MLAFTNKVIVFGIIILLLIYFLFTFQSSFKLREEWAESTENFPDTLSTNSPYSFPYY